MSFIDKARNKIQEMLGRGKQATGEATHNRDLEAEGRADRGEAGVRQAGEHVKDVGNDVKDAFKRR